MFSVLTRTGVCVSDSEPSLAADSASGKREKSPEIEERVLPQRLGVPILGNTVSSILCSEGCIRSSEADCLLLHLYSTHLFNLVLKYQLHEILDTPQEICEILFTDYYQF